MHGETSYVFCDHHGHCARIARNEADVEAFKVGHSSELNSNRTWQRRIDCASVSCAIAIICELVFHMRASDVMRPTEILSVSEQFGASGYM